MNEVCMKCKLCFQTWYIYPAKLDDSATMVNELWQTFYKVIHTTSSLTCVWIDNLYLQETTTKGLLNFLSVYMYLFVDIYYTCTIWYLTKKQIYDIKYLWKNWTSCIDFVCIHKLEGGENPQCVTCLYIVALWIRQH